MKICTCIGYIFFQKKVGDMDACIFYNYSSCCSWFWLNIKRPLIIIPFFLALFFQLGVIGFNKILSDNLLKNNYSKNVKIFNYFFIAFLHINTYFIMKKYLNVKTQSVD